MKIFLNPSFNCRCSQMPDGAFGQPPDAARQGPLGRRRRAMKFPLGRDRVPEMIRIVLTDAVYDAIASTLPKGAARWPMQRDRAIASSKSRRRWSTA